MDGITRSDPEEAALEAASRLLGERFGRQPEVLLRAPGRVNLIGGHTDYNEGFVLPCAIEQATFGAVARRRDRWLRVASREAGAEAAQIDPDTLRRRGGWIDYVQGVVASFRAAGLAVQGLDLALASSLPREVGLSSSAALEVAVVLALEWAAGLELAAEERARLAHWAETEFVGVPCGRMDQLASALGRRDHALRIDCRSFEVHPVPLPGDRLALLVVDSGVRRALAAGGYRKRREECAAAFEQARALGLLPERARSWRDVGPERLPEIERRLDPVLARRARHAVSENARVLAVCEALAAGRLERVGALLREGMASLREDYEVSCPEIDTLCAIGDSAEGCYGSRLTGAGFGGSTLHLVAPERAGAVAAAIRAGFARRFGREPAVFRVRAADGAGFVAPPSRAVRAG